MNPYQQYQQPLAGQPQGYNPYPYQGNPYIQYANPYQRLAELEKAYPQYGQTVPQPQPMQSAQPVVKSAFVTSIDEAKTANVLDGSLYIFYNTTGNGQIYSRQFDIQTGKADTVVYERTTPTETPTEQPQPVNEVQELREQFTALEAKYTALEMKVNESQRISTNDDSVEPTSAGNVPAVATNAKPGAKSKPTD